MTKLESIRRAVNNVQFNRFRFWLQMFFFVLLVYGGYLAIDFGKHLPTFACGYNKELRGGMCYLMTLQHQLEWPWQKLFSVAGLTVLTGLGIFFLWFIALNKGWCGFVCPLGTIQDWLTDLRRWTGIRYSRYSDGQFQWLMQIKYVLLALMILIPLGIGAGWFQHDLKSPFCMICPGRTIIPIFGLDFTQWSIDFSSKTNMVMTSLGLLVTGLFFIGSFIKKRFFCFYCPMGALHYLFSKGALLRLKKEGSKCTRCGDCFRVCDQEIRIIADDVTRKEIMTDDCIMCLKCVAACPEPGALKATFAGIPIFEATEEGFVKRMNKGRTDVK
ncbi:MAG: 4Fe-4S binding protein [Sideroxydans sp.]|nr:4Fe-4S binding protein [Sideroxydans sp.]